MTDGQQEQPPEPHGVGEPAAQQQPEPHGDGGTDWKAEARKWEQRAKENGQAAAELEALKAQSAADLAQAVRRAEEAEAKAAGLEAAAERARTVAAVAAEAGVSAAVLERMAGEGEEDIRANAEVLRASAPAAAYPTAPQGGTPRPPAVTREQVMAIANSRERLKAIADNIDLF